MLLALLLALCLGAAAGQLLAATPLGPAGGASSSGQVAIVSPMDGETQIFLVDVHTGRQWRLTAPPGRSTAPAWSPDGQRIAFVKSMNQDAQIYVTDADGSGARRLTALPGINLLPVWSPDSRRMAFLSNRDGEMAVYVMRADGSGQRRLAPVYTDLSALPFGGVAAARSEAEVMP